MNSRLQGNIGLADAIAHFEKKGVRVLLPLTDSLPYDLVIDDNGRLDRVQVKTTTQKTEANSFEVGICVKGGNKSRYSVKSFDPTEYDWLYVLTLPDEDRYLIPTSEISNKISITVGKKYEMFKL
jgi:hypothetical protein